MRRYAQIEQIARNDEQQLAFGLRAGPPALREGRASTVELERGHKLRARCWPDWRLEEALGSSHGVRRRRLGRIGTHQPDHTLQPGVLGGASWASQKMLTHPDLIAGGKATFGEVDQPGKGNVNGYVTHGIFTSSNFHNAILTEQFRSAKIH
jgi:hypothetical protein